MIYILIENKIIGGYFNLKVKYIKANKILKNIYSIVHKGYLYEICSYSEC